MKAHNQPEVLALMKIQKSCKELKDTEMSAWQALTHIEVLCSHRIKELTEGEKVIV